MVFYFKARAVAGNYTIFMGLDKYENEELIKYGFIKDIWSKMYHKRGLWAMKAKNGGAFPRHDPKPKAPAVAEKPPKFYPAEDVKKPLLNKRKPKPTKL
ncbi:hypothetical protein Gotur_031213, partial [Gossypium turneri]